MAFPLITLQRVLATLDSQILVELTQLWTSLLEDCHSSAQTLSQVSKCLVAIDGKTIRGKASQTLKALHIVSAYAADLGIS